jgi:hypothetical protein
MGMGCGGDVWTYHKGKGFVAHLKGALAGCGMVAPVRMEKVAMPATARLFVQA